MSFAKQDIDKIKTDWFDTNFVDYKILANYDMVSEVAEDYNLKPYRINKVMKDRNSNDFYICGAFCVVRNEDGQLVIYDSKDKKGNVLLTESYLNARYYKLSDLNNVALCK